MAQYALPVQDNQTGPNWVEGAGDADGDAFDELDEGFGAGRGSGSGPDDATTYWVNTGSLSFAISMGLTTGLSDPSSSTGHIMRGRVCKNASGGRQVDSQLFFQAPGQSGIFNTLSNLSTTWVTHSYTLSGTEADAITDYSTSLVVAMYGVEVGGGTPRDPYCSALEFECPDAPAAGGSLVHPPHPMAHMVVR